MDNNKQCNHEENDEKLANEVDDLYREVEKFVKWSDQFSDKIDRLIQKVDRANRFLDRFMPLLRGIIFWFMFGAVLYLLKCNTTGSCHAIAVNF